ncbi:MULTISPECIES: hypothetical protein [Haloarcula]|uniref:Uncharacterized protein n=1 Tax=Haloarcula pellucida TaxID=1427151 RepID=A0A830GKP1_9EURY|nr:MULTISPECIES: hypothetical protein [Halomicroarcula]MBX0348567.1 hypothetical protein [Halomicroarcula pellucida]MDS0279375.1 hypothetical protein [Halomicroarcula sp. S1AR25-4]GGN92804.1 hypothetical protein GCM10009030_17410 [Halomicroarcula pellucida]
MERTLSYGLVGTIGVSASTIASAVVGDPFPVVVPALVGGAVIAGHHVRHRQQTSDQTEIFTEEGSA